MTSSESPYQIAVVMPVLNEALYIGSTLEQLYLQEFPMEKVEVVIADGGSTDQTREIAASYRSRFGSLKILDNPMRLPSSGRNVGMRNSTAPIILVLDGHCYLPGKRLLADVVEIFDRTGADCLCRPQPMNPPDIDEFQTVVAICRSSLLGHKPGSDIYTDREGEVDPTSSGAMYRRSVFDWVGYFDDGFDACEDVDFNYRIKKAGLKAYLSPKLSVHYYPRKSLRGLFRQMLRYGTGRFRFASKHRQWSLVQWMAGAGALVCILLFILGLVSGAAREAFVTVVGVYALIVIAFSGLLALKERRPGCLLYGPLIFPAIHFGLGLGFLVAAIERYIKDRG
jgi:succinoglycan biosynthesis protein ExoA